MYTLEQIIVSKRRVQSVRQLRNDLDFTSQGDKCYKNPEYTQRFYNEGGLIPGSTNRINNNKTLSKKSDNFFETLDLKVKTLDPNKIYTNKVANQELVFQTDYVKGLKVWDVNLKKEIALIVDKNKKTGGKLNEVKKPVVVKKKK